MPITAASRLSRLNCMHNRLRHTGATLPIFTILFADFVDTFGKPGADFTAAINKLSLSFTILAIVAGVAAFAEAAFWMLSGTRITNRLRQRYLSGLLKQEVAYFDTEQTTGGKVCHCCS